MELYGYIFVASIVLIAIAIFCHVKSGSKMRRFILVFNGVIYLGFLMLFVLNLLSDRQSDKLVEQYDRHAGSILSGWTYQKTENGYHYLSSSYLFGSDPYLVPEETCEIAPMAKLTHDAIIYTKKGEQLGQNRDMEVDDCGYIYAPQIVRVEPEYFGWTLTYMILGGGILIIGNLIVLIIVAVNLIKKRKQNAEN